MTEPIATETSAPTPAADAAADLEAAKAAKRKEIEEKLAALKLAKEKEEKQRTIYFGTHDGITCDGCGVSPVVGYRYKCKDCPNHDICENCYDGWAQGKMTNGLGKQVISSKVDDHRFELHKDKQFQGLVKKAGGAGPTEKKEAKIKPNDPCTCGSGKKYKKCCGK